MVSSEHIIKYATTLNALQDSWDPALPKIPDTMSILRGAIWSTESIRDSINEDTGNYNTLWLFGDTCKPDMGTAGWESRNCSMSCGDPSNLFASLEGLWTCLTLASVAIVWPSISNDSEAKTAMSDNMNQMKEFNISAFDGEKVLNMVQSCAAAECQAGDCDVQYPPTDGEGGQEDIMGRSITLVSVCDSIPVKASNDISGPGVLVSYIIQTLLSLYSYLSMGLIAVTRSDTERHFSKHPNEKSNGWPLRLVTMQRSIRINLTHASSTLLAEFQEAQCFFVVAVAVAQLFANYQNADFNDTDGLASLIFQHNSVITLAAVGMQSTVLTQAGLRHARLMSVYSLVWTTSAVVLASAAASTVMVSNAELVYKFIDNEIDGTGLEECGGRFSLRELCLDVVETNDSRGMFLLSVSIVGVELGLIWLEMGFSVLLSSGWMRKRKDRLEFLKGSIWMKKHDVVLLSVKVIMILAELVLLGASTINCINQVRSFSVPRQMSDTIGFSAASSTGSWTIGQIIAMLIWAPSISKYLYLVIFGVQRSFEMRMSADYGVHKKSDQKALMEKIARHEGMRGHNDENQPTDGTIFLQDDATP